MGALSKYFLSPIYKEISNFFSTVLPEALRFIVLSLFVLWSCYRRNCSRHEYMALIDKKGSKFVYARKLRPVLEMMESECSICLSEYEEGDKIRELECKHMFHNNCLEKWLHGCEATCPLCRSTVVPKEIVSEHRQCLKEHQLLKKSVEEELAVLFLSAINGRSCHSGF